MTTRDLFAIGVVSAGGELELDLGRPASGFYWRLVQAAIVDQAPATAHAAAVVVVSKGAGDVTRMVGVLTVPSWIPPWAAPVTVLDDEAVSMHVYGATPTRTLVATIHVEEVRAR